MGSIARLDDREPDEPDTINRETVSVDFEEHRPEIGLGVAGSIRLVMAYDPLYGLMRHRVAAACHQLWISP
jgi:hypothetical protein